MTNSQYKIDPAKAFGHLVYEYRCLVRAEFAYKQADKHKCINDFIPEIGTVARNAVLQKARSLIKFYMPLSRDTDITSEKYFGISLSVIDNKLYKKLENIYRSIEVHDLHLTVWRDPSYRNNKSDKMQRREWNIEQDKIVENLIKALEVISKTSGLNDKWQRVFRELHDCCANVLKGDREWPEEFSSPEKIEKHLKSIGIP